MSALLPLCAKYPPAALLRQSEKPSIYSPITFSTNAGSSPETLNRANTFSPPSLARPNVSPLQGQFSKLLRLYGCVCLAKNGCALVDVQGHIGKIYVEQLLGQPAAFRQVNGQVDGKGSAHGIAFLLCKMPGQ